MVTSVLVNTDQYKLGLSCSNGLRDAFLRDHVVVLPRFFKPDAFEMLVAEVRRMAQRKKRRDFLMPGSNNTPRRMSTLSGKDIREMSSLIPMLYFDRQLLSFLADITSEIVYPVRDDVENYVCNFLHMDG